MKKEDYSLSIIVPVYNAENTLERCVDSILKQTYTNFELVLVDDGSTDSSPVMCDEYVQTDSRVKVVHISNSGSFQARKAGVKTAAGNVITFADADDWLDKDAFEWGMQILTQYEPDILAYIYDCGNGKPERHLYEEGLYCGTDIRDRIIPGMMFDSFWGGRRLNPSLCCKLIKKELYEKVTESVKNKITLGEDALVTYPAVCLAESIFICNKVLYHYSNNIVSCTHTYPVERIAEVKAFQDHIRRLFSEMGIWDQMKWQTENYVRSFLAMMIENWYGIDLTPVSFCFPFDKIPKGSRVFIYGAGNVGRSYINELKVMDYVSIAGWADKNYDSIREYNGVRIIAPEQVKEVEFDMLLIAVWDQAVAEIIRKNLIDNGNSEEKIIWIKPVRII